MYDLHALPLTTRATGLTLSLSAIWIAGYDASPPRYGLNIVEIEYWSNLKRETWLAGRAEHETESRRRGVE